MNGNGDQDWFRSAEAPDPGREHPPESAAERTDELPPVAEVHRQDGRPGTAGRPAHAGRRRPGPRDGGAPGGRGTPPPAPSPDPAPDKVPPPGGGRVEVEEPGGAPRARPRPGNGAEPGSTPRRAARRGGAARERAGHPRPEGRPPTTAGGTERERRRRHERAEPPPGAAGGGSGPPPADPPPPGHGHGHGHGHGPSTPASRQVRLLLAWLLTPCLLAALTGMVLLYPSGYESPTPEELGFGAEPVHGDVTATAASSCQTSLAEPGTSPPPPEPPPGGGEPDCVRLEVTLTSGEGAGRVITQVLPVEPGTPRFAVGDQVVLSYAGSEPDNPMSYQVVDYQRGPALAWLAALFALSVVLLARWKGLVSLLGLALSFLVLVFFVLPAILAGQDAVLVGVVGSGVIMFIVLYLAHGFSARTSTAVLGTLLSLTLIALLGLFFMATTRLTGLDDETTNLITIVGSSVDPRGLLLAGILIGALGVLDDVTVTQTSAVWELRAANPDLGWRQLYAAGLRIGRDHISAAVNTLALAYAGAALPMLLAYSLSGIDFGTLAGAQVVAQEIVRTLVGSIGLVAAVPITTAIAAVVASREDPPNPGDRITRSTPDPEGGGGTDEEVDGDGPDRDVSDTGRTADRTRSEAARRRRRAEPGHRPSLD